MIYIIHTFPELTQKEKTDLIQFPKTPNDLKRFIEAIEIYNETHFYHVLSLFVFSYLL